MQKSSTKTLFDYWNSLRGARSAPDRRDIDPARIKAALSNTFILERDIENEFSFRLAGSHICSAYARELKGRSFTRLWHQRDRDAMETLVRAVTEDHAVALVTFEGRTPVHAKASFEAILLPVRHNGSTSTRLLGALTAIDTPYWFGVQPIMEQRITGLRLIWPDEAFPADLLHDNMSRDGFSREGSGARSMARDIATSIAHDVSFHDETAAMPMPLSATVFGRAARRYAHLAVIDGGRPR